MYTTRPRILLVAAASLVLLSSLPTKAAAAPVTFTFNGDVTFVSPLLGSAFTIGDDMTGSLIYSSELVDSNVSANIGAYAPLSSFTFAVDTDTFAFVDGSGSIRVENGLADQLGFTADVTGSPVGSFRPWRISLGLTGNSSTLASDALPTSFDATDFGIVRSFVVTFTNKADPYDRNSPGVSFTGVSGTLFGNAAVVPEPATLTLLCAGAAAIGLRRRHRG